MAVGLNTTVPWIMCQQPDAPASVVSFRIKINTFYLHSSRDETKQALRAVLHEEAFVSWLKSLSGHVREILSPCLEAESVFEQINTCNGFYCDGWTPNENTKPTMWTENWTGWYVPQSSGFWRPAMHLVTHLKVLVLAPISLPILCYTPRCQQSFDKVIEQSDPWNTRARMCTETLSVFTGVLCVMCAGSIAGEQLCRRGPWRTLLLQWQDSSRKGGVSKTITWWVHLDVDTRNKLKTPSFWSLSLMNTAQILLIDLSVELAVPWRDKFWADIGWDCHHHLWLWCSSWWIRSEHLSLCLSLSILFWFL